MVEDVVSLVIVAPNEKAPISAGPSGRLDTLVNGIAHKYQAPARGLRIDKRPGFTSLATTTKANGASAAPISNPSVSGALNEQLVVVGNGTPFVYSKAAQEWQTPNTYAIYTDTLRQRGLFSANATVQTGDCAYIGNVGCYTFRTLRATTYTTECMLIDSDNVIIRAPFATTGGFKTKVVADGTHFWVFSINSSGVTMDVQVFDTTGHQVASLGLTFSDTAAWDVTYNNGVYLVHGSAALLKTIAFTLSGSTISAVSSSASADVSGGVQFITNNSGDGFLYVFAVDVSTNAFTYKVIRSTGAISVTYYSGAAFLIGNVSGFVDGSANVTVAYSILQNNTAPDTSAQDNYTVVVQTLASAPTVPVQLAVQRSLSVASRAWKDANGAYYCAMYYQSTAGNGQSATTADISQLEAQPTFFVYNISKQQLAGTFAYGIAQMLWASQGSASFYDFALPSVCADGNGTLHCPLAIDGEVIPYALNADGTAEYFTLSSMVDFMLSADAGTPVEAIDTLFVPGTQATVFNGKDWSESGFSLAPELNSVSAGSDSTGKLTPNEPYTYAALYEELDDNGTVVQSIPSNLVQFKLTTNPIDVYISPDGVDATSKTWTFTNGNFDSSYTGGTIAVSGCFNGGNNSTFTISAVLSSTQIVTSTAGSLVTEIFTGRSILVSPTKVFSAVSGDQVLSPAVTGSGTTVYKLATCSPVPGDVGKAMVVTGAAHSGNNGTFTIKYIETTDPSFSPGFVNLTVSGQTNETCGPGTTLKISIAYPVFTNTTTDNYTDTGGPFGSFTWTFKNGGFTNALIGQHLIVSGTSHSNGTFLINGTTSTTLTTTSTGAGTEYFTNTAVASTFAGTQSAGLTISTLRATTKPNVIISIFRSYNTTNGANGAAGTILRKITNDANPIYNDPTIDVVTFTDVVSDSVAAIGEALYTQPLDLTAATALDKYPAPAFSQGTTFQDRVLLVGYDNAVWFSLPIVPNQAIAFNPAFRITLPSNDEILAVKALDTRVEIFCKRSHWAVTPSFPNALGVGSIPTPQQLPFTTGSLGPATLLPLGAIYSADAGIYLSDRSLNTSYIGAPVEDLLATNSVTEILIGSAQWVFFSLVSSTTMLVYDLISDVWYQWTLPSVPVAMTIWQGTLAYADAAGVVHVLDTLDTTSYTDNGAAITTSFTFVPINIAGVNGFQKLRQIQWYGQYRGPHTITVSVGYDDDINIYDETFSVTYATSPGVYRNEIMQSRSTMQALQLSFSDVGSPPGNTFSLENIGLRIGRKVGLGKLPKANRIPPNGA